MHYAQNIESKHFPSNISIFSLGSFRAGEVAPQVLRWNLQRPLFAADGGAPQAQLEESANDLSKVM